MSDPQELIEITQLNDDNGDKLGRSIFRAAWGLSLFAIITAGLIALTQIVTKERISEAMKQARAKALLEIVPLGEFDNDLLSDAFWLEAEQQLGLSEAAEAFVAVYQGKPRYFILPLVAPDGYTGPIRLIMSVDLSGTLIGLRVIEHKETPGLGDKIEVKKSDWVRQFEGRSLMNTGESAWAVKKDGGDFDQMTGATITPRAIVSAVYKGLNYFRRHQTQLLVAAGVVPPEGQAPASTQEQEGKP